MVAIPVRLMASIETLNASDSALIAGKYIWSKWERMKRFM